MTVARDREARKTTAQVQGTEDRAGAKTQAESQELFSNISRISQKEKAQADVSSVQLEITCGVTGDIRAPYQGESHL